LAWVALGLLVEPGNRDLGILVRQVGVVEALHRLLAGKATKQLVTATATRRGAADPYETAERALAEADRLGVRLVTPVDEEYPPQLEDLVTISEDVADPVRRNTFPPHCLWVRGGPALVEACEQSVAIVGSRASTSYGEHVGRDFAFGLAERGWTVVSGGAFGIDNAAHRGALAASGRTIAVLACGIDRPYPQSHAGLFDVIARTGLVVSEWPPGADPHRHRFLIRNRVIAAATVGTVMIEANARSGARFTLNRARRLNRLFLAVPGPITSAASVGCHEAVRDGATLVATVPHIIDAVGRLGDDLAPAARATPRARDSLTPLQARVLDGVRPRKPLTAAEIAAAVGVSARDARRVLPALTLAGFVVQVGGTYRLARSPSHEP